MTDDDIHALIIDLIESHVDEEDRQPGIGLGYGGARIYDARRLGPTWG